MTKLPYRIAFKWVGRWDTDGHKLRLFRIMWTNGLNPRAKGWDNAFASLSLVRRLLDWDTEWQGWEISFFGIRLHIKHNSGGWYV